MEMISRLTCVLPCVALMACSSGSSDDGDVTGFATLEEGGEAYSDLFDQFGASTLDPSIDLLTTGTAEYSGVVGILMGEGTDFEADAFGTTTMVLDFDQGDLTGSATDFVRSDDVNADGVQVDGTLTYENGVLDPFADITGDASVRADLVGTLQDSEWGSVNVDMYLTGDLYGGGELVAAGVGGTVELVDEGETLDITSYGVIGERQ